MLVATANQTIGPFWHLIEDPTWADLTRFGAEGDKIILTGTLFDGAGNTVADAAVEIWQTSPAASETFPAFGRCRTDGNGSFRFTTLKPGPVAGLGNAQQAPHVAISIFARGLLKALTTRFYFPDRGRSAPPHPDRSKDFPRHLAVGPEAAGGQRDSVHGNLMVDCPARPAPLCQKPRPGSQACP
jgi:protocatechuate 3,4-dioxygenase alpha subunit